MLEVELHIKGGGLVTIVRVPPFQRMPEAILWGQRYFFHQSEKRYEEGMVWFSPPGNEVPIQDRTEVSP